MKKLLSIGLILFLCACTTIIESDKTKLLVVTSKMDKSIFLVPVTPSQQTVYIDIKNFTDINFFDLSEPVINAMTKKGYKVVKNPALAHFMIQLNVMDIKENKSENMNNFSIGSDLKISQRVPESIYLRNINETKQSKKDFANLSFNYDEFEMTETLAGDNKTALFWKTYQTKITTITNNTELSFNEIARIIITKICSIVVNVF